MELENYVAKTNVSLLTPSKMITKLTLESEAYQMELENYVAKTNVSLHAFRFMVGPGHCPMISKYGPSLSKAVDPFFLVVKKISL